MKKQLTGLEANVLCEVKAQILGPCYLLSHFLAHIQKGFGERVLGCLINFLFIFFLGIVPEDILMQKKRRKKKAPLVSVFRAACFSSFLFLFSFFLFLFFILMFVEYLNFFEIFQYSDLAETLSVLGSGLCRVCVRTDWHGPVSTDLLRLRMVSLSANFEHCGCHQVLQLELQEWVCVLPN